jgi:septal ring factor EnvC (AmiA/AmiB activator)
LGEVIEDNKEYTEKKEHRASVSNQIQPQNMDVDSIINAPVKVEDILDKSEEELAKIKSEKK